MNCLALIALCSAALGASDGETYAEAHQASAKSGKPMLVMVSTDWCPACQVMKRSIIPQLRKRPVFKRVAYATVNPDQDRDLAQQLTGGGQIPQLVMYRKTPRGWTREVMVGSQSVESVESFISQGVAADEGDAKDDKSAKPQTEEKTAATATATAKS